jgi:hypothetical protein
VFRLPKIISRSWFRFLQRIQPEHKWILFAIIVQWVHQLKKEDSQVSPVPNHLQQRFRKVSTVWHRLKERPKLPLFERDIPDGIDRRIEIGLSASANAVIFSRYFDQFEFLRSNQIGKSKGVETTLQFCSVIAARFIVRRTFSTNSHLMESSFQLRHRTFSISSRCWTHHCSQFSNLLNRGTMEQHITCAGWFHSLVVRGVWESNHEHNNQTVLGYDRFQLRKTRWSNLSGDEWTENWVDVASSGPFTPVQGA